MDKSNNMGLLERLNDFLSTDTRKLLFFHYVFTKTSPSDLSEATKVPISTVDMVTNTLRLMELVKEVEGPEKNKNYYEVDMEKWVSENLVSLGFGFIKDDLKKELLEIMGDRKFLALSFILTDPDFSMSLYNEPLKMGDDLIVFKLMKLFKYASPISSLPSYILMSMLIFPSFRQIKDNMASDEGKQETLNLIKAQFSNYPFLARPLEVIDAAALDDYGKKRSSLATIAERLIEQELQSLSMEKAKKVIQSKEKPKAAQTSTQPTAKPAAPTDKK